MSITPSPVAVRTTVLPYLSFTPSVLTLVVGGLAIASIVFYVVQTLRMPKGTFWKRNFRSEPYVNPRLGVGSLVAMVVLVLLTIPASEHDKSVHAAALRAQEAQEAAVQAEVKSALSGYYGVAFLDENERIYSYADLARRYDDLPGDPISIRLPDGSEPGDCYIGTAGGFYVLSCGPKASVIALRPAAGH